MRNIKMIMYLMSVLMYTSACRTVREPKFETPKDRNEAWQQDINYLRTTFPKYNHSFTENSAKYFNEVLLNTFDDIPTLTDNEIYVNIMKAIASTNDVHTHISLTPSTQKLRRMPIRFYWFKEGLYVIKSKKEYEGLLGAQILSINGKNPKELIKILKHVIPGNETYVRYESNYFLNSPDFLHGLKIIPDPETVSISFLKTDGSTEKVSLSTEPIGAKVFGYQSWRELSPITSDKATNSEYIHVFDNKEIPPYLRSPNKSCFQLYQEESKTLYIQINKNTNYNCKMSDFAKEVRNQFLVEQVESVIVDLRFNTGGNLVLTSALVKGIPKWHKGKGKIYIIIGGPTFSAGIVTAARLKYYSGDKAVIVGEDAAEGLKFWAESKFFRLPNSKLLLFAPQAYHNWRDTNYDKEKKLFWLLKIIGVPAGDLNVDLPASVAYKDYIKGIDSILKIIEQDIWKTNQRL